MKSKLIWVALLAFSSPSWAQNLSERYASMLTPEAARSHLSILASDEFEGRETGKRGAELAANYISAEFKKLGLQGPVNGSFFQEVGLVENSISVEKFQINSQKLNHLKDFYIADAGKRKKIKAEEIVFIGYGISANEYDDLKGIDLTGKVVLFMAKGEPAKNGVSLLTKSASLSEWSTVRGKRIENILSKKPALILAVSPDLESYLERAAGHLAQAQISLKKDLAVADASEPEIIQLTNKAADVFLKRSGNTLNGLLKKINQQSAPSSQRIKADLELSYGNETRSIKAANVLGYLEGSDLKEELLVISAHYDHVGMNSTGSDKVFNGADDDGSGTTAVLEMARAFSKAKADGNGPRRSILFLAVVGEEKGLLGSEWYSDHPVFPLKNTVTNLNIDMIGRVDPAHQKNPDYCYLIGSDKLSTELHRISEETNAKFTKLTIDYKYNDPNDPERIYYRSDHYNFAKHGIPIIFYFNGVHEDYHQVSDEISKINFPLLMKRAQLVFHTAWEIANRDTRPVVDVANDMPQSR